MGKKKIHFIIFTAHKILWSHRWRMCTTKRARTHTHTHTRTDRSADM